MFLNAFVDRERRIFIGIQELSLIHTLCIVYSVLFFQILHHGIHITYFERIRSMVLLQNEYIIILNRYVRVCLCECYVSKK